MYFNEIYLYQNSPVQPLTRNSTFKLDPASVSRTWCQIVQVGNALHHLLVHVMKDINLILIPSAGARWDSNTIADVACGYGGLLTRGCSVPCPLTKVVREVLRLREVILHCIWRWSVRTCKEYREPGTGMDRGIDACYSHRSECRCTITRSNATSGGIRWVGGRYTVLPQLCQCLYLEMIKGKIKSGGLSASGRHGQTHALLCSLQMPLTFS